MNLKKISGIYLSVWQARRNTASLWPLCFIFAAAVLLAILIPAQTQGRAHWQTAIGIFTLVSLGNVLIGWFWLVTHMLREHTPANAQLVPRLRPAMKAAFLLAWALLGAVPTALCAFAFGHFILFWLGIGLTLLSFALLFATGNPFYLAPFMLASINGNRLSIFIQRSALFAGDPLWASLCVLAMLILAAWTTSHLFSLDGDVLVKRHRALATRMELMKLDDAIRSGNGLTGLINGRALYDRSLQRLLKKPGSRSALLRMGFGYGMHWCCLASPVFFSFAFLAAIFCLIAVFPNLRFVLTMIGFGATLAPASMLCSHAAANFLKSLHLSKNEQRLLVLLPGCPQKKALNRYLARAALGQIALAVATTFLVLSCDRIGSTNDANADNMFPMLIALWIGSLASSIFIFQSYASMKNPNAAKLKIFLFPIAAALFFMYLRSSPLPYADSWWPAVLLVAVIAAAMRWRWIKAVDGPPALPAGRLRDA